LHPNTITRRGTVWTYIKTLLVGSLGAVLAFSIYQGYVMYQQHQALWIWAQTVEQRLQKSASVPLPKTQEPVVKK